MQEKVTETRIKTRLTDPEHVTLRGRLKFKTCCINLLILKKKKNPHTIFISYIKIQSIYTKKVVNENQLCRQIANPPIKHKI